MEEITQDSASSQALALIKDSGLQTATSDYIKSELMHFLEQAEITSQNAFNIVVKDELDTKTMAEAKTILNKLVKFRTGANATKKTLKSDALAYGKVCDGFYNIIVGFLEPIENHLKSQKDFLKIQKEKKLDDRLKARLELITVDLRVYISPEFDIREASDEDFDHTLSGAVGLKFQDDEKIRIEKEQLEAERIENEKLRAQQVTFNTRKSAITSHELGQFFDWDLDIATMSDDEFKKALGEAQGKRHDDNLLKAAQARQDEYVADESEATLAEKDLQAEEDRTHVPLGVRDESGEFEAAAAMAEEGNEDKIALESLCNQIQRVIDNSDQPQTEEGLKIFNNAILLLGKTQSYVMEHKANL